MNATRLMADGFYGVTHGTFYVYDGRAWLVGSDDGYPLQEIRLDQIPAEAEPINHLLTPEEATETLQQIEAAYGVSLIATAD